MAESIVSYLYANPQAGSLESVNLRLGKGGVFDVYVDGRRIYSKHETGRYPKLEELLPKLFPNA